MSVELDDVKAALRVTHNDDDALLARLIGSAIRECLAFLRSEQLPTVPLDDPGSPAEVFVPEDVFQGIVLMVAADYEASPTERQAYRSAAETLWGHYREHFV